MHTSTLLLMTSRFFLRKLRFGHSLRLKIKHLRLRNSTKGTRVKAAPAGGLRWRKSVGTTWEGRTAAPTRKRDFSARRGKASCA